MRTATLKLPRALPHQREVLDDPSKRKLWRAGRRVGKSVGGMLAGTRGHGPKLASGQRALKGMLDGGNVAWLTKTYKQSKVIWRRLLRRFGPLEGVVVKIDREDKRIEMIGNRGALTVWTGHTRDAIDNLRGDQYDGVIVDEGAYIDLQYAIDEVLVPALLDRDGWLFVFSTPNGAWDGNDQRIIPSYFNRLCQAIFAGEAKHWKEWHNRTEDNPRLPPHAVAELRASYPPDSPTVQQEMDALLLAGGLLALAIDTDTLLVPAREIPKHWTYFGAVDWGYSHPWAFGLFAVNESGTVTLVQSATARKQEPKEIAESVRKLLASRGVTFKQLAYTVAGGDVFDEHGRSRGLSGETIHMQWAQCGWSVIRSQASGAGMRVTSLNNLRSYLAEDRFKVFDTPANRRVLGVLASRVSDPNDPEDVFKTDADVNGRGGDDEYDMVRYGLFSHPITAKAPVKTVGRPSDSGPSWKDLAKRHGTLKEAPPRGVRVPREYEELS